MWQGREFGGLFWRRRRGEKGPSRTRNSTNDSIFDLYLLPLVGVENGGGKLVG
jgi:hypothetical protein